MLPEYTNLAAKMDADELEKIAAEIMENFEEDWQSSTEWRTRHAEWIEIYYQKDRPRHPPWEGSATESIPILVEACNQFHSRAFTALFPNRNIIKAIPVGYLKEPYEDRSERVGKHMSWQLMVQDRNYKKDKDKLLLSCALHGSFFTKTFFDPRRARNVIQNVRAEDLIVPYGYGPRNLEDIDRKTHVIWRSVNDTKILARDGYLIKPAEVWQEQDPSVTQVAQDKSVGAGQPEMEGYQAKLLEHHCLLDLDDDGIAEPYIVTLDAQTRKVLRIAIRWDVDRQGQPVNNKYPVEYFTHYEFLPNPDGFYGLGMGHLVAEINKAVNRLLRSQEDAATLANVGNSSGFVSQAAGMAKGAIEMVLGKFMTLTSDDLNKHVKQLQFPGPSQAAFVIMEMLMKRADRLATTTEMLTGQAEKVMQPTTALALIDQALQIYSATLDRLISAWGDELAKIYRLNGLYLEEEQYFAFMGAGGTLERMAIAREDYQPDLMVLPLADPKMSVDQKRITKAQAEYEFATNNPLIINSPPHYYAASRNFLEAIGTENVDEILPQPQQEEPQRVDDPRQENFGALLPMPDVPQVFPDQNHLEHLKEHEQFMADPAWGDRMTPEGAQAMQQHIQNHIAFLYAATETTLLEDFEGGEDGSGPMDAAQGNGLDVSGVGGPVPGGAGLANPQPGNSAASPGPTGSV